MKTTTPRLLSSLLLLLLVASLPPAAVASPQESDEEARLDELRDRLRQAEDQVNRLRAELYSSDSRAAARGALERARRDELEARRRAREADRYADLLVARAGALALMPQRARIGVTVRTRADEQTDAIGAVLEEVTPGGPADEAGLESGDIVTRWNGESLLEDLPADEEADKVVIGWSFVGGDSSAPAARLIARSRLLEPGEKVELTYRRDGETLTATVTARALPTPTFAAELPTGWVAPRAPRAPRPEVPGSDFFVLALGGPWGDMEVVTVREELGEYFGTDRGLLVIEPPSEDPFGLRPGDVILSIGDREPRDLPHALRILRSYEPDEEVNLTVQRKGKPITLSAKLPESSGRFGIRTPEPVVAPTPPSVPPPSI